MDSNTFINPYANPTSTPDAPVTLYQGLDLFGPWQNGWDDQPWAFPTTSQLDYYKSKGLTYFRVPLLWENLQPELFGPFNPTYLAAMDKFVAECQARGEHVSFTFINQAVYPGDGGNVIGSPEVPASAFYALWTKMAEHYKDNPTVWSYDVINEPYHDRQWDTVHAQATINAIRSVDPNKPIIVSPSHEGGDGYTSAFQGFNDPSHKLWYQAHVYFDADGSGSYTQSYSESGAYPTIGVDRIRPFVEWCKAHQARCTVGEVGIPGGWQSGTIRSTRGAPTNDPRWDVALDNFLTYLGQNGISWNYWNAGPYGDINSVEPTNRGQERPQMAVLEKHVNR